ncbi:MAG: long-chain fatty acid--CoA ligase [Deltaproteobacteria bacterium]|nr:long-chain fatty acid--CoA ligase [Deltaproteobacteria bacterium]
METIPHILLDRAAKDKGAAVLLSYDTDSHGQTPAIKSVSWQELLTVVQDLSLGLISLGIGTYENIVIISENRPEWIISELAVLSINASLVPVYTTLTAKEIEFILKDCSAKAVIVSNEHLLKKIISIKGLLPDLKNIIIFDIDSEIKGAISFSKVIKLGKEFKETELLKNKKMGIKEDDTAVIIYTSGTTGRTKGVCLTHKNIVSNIKSALEKIDIKEDDTYLSFLPLSHSFEHLVHLAVLHQEAKIAYSKGLTNVAADMKVFNPTIMIGVPFFFARIKNKVIETIEKGSWIKKIVFKWAYEKSAKSKVQKAKFVETMIGKLIFKKIRDALCPTIRYFISGGAPLSKDVAEFFWTIGIPIFEGYGLTETSPVVSVNTAKEIKLGTVGKPIPYIEVKIADDGEILIKGPNIMKGYLNMPEETSLVIRDGWFHTGDIGEIDKYGFIKITDRKKDIIVNDLGKNIAPQKIEGILRTDEFIKEAVVFGDKKPYIAALIVPDMEKLKIYLQSQGNIYNEDEKILSDAYVHKFYEKRIRGLSKDLSRFEQIRKFNLIPPLSSENGELTPTLKVKRRVVEERYKKVLEGLYEDKEMH